MDAKVAGEDAVRDLYRHLYRRAADSNRRAPREGGGNDGYEPTPSYTIVRPSGLLDGPGTGPGGLAANQGGGRRLRQSSGRRRVLRRRGEVTGDQRVYVRNIRGGDGGGDGDALAGGHTQRSDGGGGGGGADAADEGGEAAARGSQETPGKEVTARERQGGSWDALFEGIQPDA